MTLTNDHDQREMYKFKLFKVHQGFFSVAPLSLYNSGA